MQVFLKKSMHLTHAFSTCWILYILVFGPCSKRLMNKMLLLFSMIIAFFEGTCPGLIRWSAMSSGISPQSPCFDDIPEEIYNYRNIYTLAFKAYLKNRLVFATILIYKRLFPWKSWLDLCMIVALVNLKGTLLAGVTSQMRKHERPKYCHERNIGDSNKLSIKTFHFVM